MPENLVDLMYARACIKTSLANLEYNPAFSRAICAAREALSGIISDNDLAKTFQVPGPTLARWADGVTTPALIARESVLHYLLNLVSERLEKPGND